MTRLGGMSLFVIASKLHNVDKKKPNKMIFMNISTSCDYVKCMV